MATLPTASSKATLTGAATYGGANLDSLYAQWSTSFSSLTGQALDQAQQIIRSNFPVQFAANGVDSARYDFMTMAFVTDGSGIDGVLDSLRIRVDYASGEVSVSDAMGNPLVFNMNTVSDGLAHIAGPDLRYRDGHHNEYHAKLVYEVLRVLFSFKPQQITSGLVDWNETLDCSQGGSRQRIIQRPGADNNDTFLEQYDHQGCTGQRLPDPLDNIAVLDAPPPAMTANWRPAAPTWTISTSTARPAPPA